MTGSPWLTITEYYSIQCPRWGEWTGVFCPCTRYQQEIVPIDWPYLYKLLAKARTRWSYRWYEYEGCLRTSTRQVIVCVQAFDKILYVRVYVVGLGKILYVGAHVTVGEMTYARWRRRRALKGRGILRAEKGRSCYIFMLMSSWKNIIHGEVFSNVTISWWELVDVVGDGWS